MKLYTFDMAPNPRRLGLFLQYKGIELETEQVDLGKQEQFSDRFKAINPDCSVPALQVNDKTALVDVVAICLYLEALYPERSLMGANDLERAQVVGWMHRIFFGGLLAVAEMLRNQGDAFKDRALPGPVACEQIPALVERGRKRLAFFFQSMDETLSERDFLVGDHLTQADIDVLVLCEFAGWVKQSVPPDCTALQRYIERVRAALA